MAAAKLIDMDYQVVTVRTPRQCIATADLWPAQSWIPASRDNSMIGESGPVESGDCPASSYDMPGSNDMSSPVDRPTAQSQSPASSSAQRISVLIASRNRPQEVRTCIESIAAQDSQPLEIVVLDDGSEPALKDDVGMIGTEIPIRWLRNETPAGVSGARNTLVENASGEVLVFIDDDAWLVKPGELDKINELFASDSEPGLVAFLIHLNAENSGDVQVPFTKKTLSRDPGIIRRRQNASYFVGAGHAISKRVFDKCGLYPVEFVYGHEELDLSYRAVNQGFSIIYDPSIEVVHAPASSQITGAGKRRFESYYVTRNRLWLAHRNLPWRYAISYSVAWSGYYLLKSIKHRQVGNWLLAMKDGIFGIKRSTRQPLSKRAINYISQHHGRLWR